MSSYKRTYEYLKLNDVPIQDFDDKRYTEFVINLRKEFKLKTLRGFCNIVAKKMCEEFSDLKLVRGYCRYNPHWWCVRTNDNKIIDPTSCQFWLIDEGFPHDSEYDEYSLEKHGYLPIGRCMNCAAETFEDSYSQSACSKECNDELIREYKL